MASDLQTIRMAVAALRSAADDLMKTDPTLRMHVELGKATRLILGMMLKGHLVSVRHVGMILSLAQRIEDNYRT